MAASLRRVGEAAWEVGDSSSVVASTSKFASAAMLVGINGINGRRCWAIVAAGVLLLCSRGEDWEVGNSLRRGLGILLGERPPRLRGLSTGILLPAAGFRGLALLSSAGVDGTEMASGELPEPNEHVGINGINGFVLALLSSSLVGEATRRAPSAEHVQFDGATTRARGASSLFFELGIGEATRRAPSAEHVQFDGSTTRTSGEALVCSTGEDDDEPMAGEADTPSAEGLRFEPGLRVAPPALELISRTGDPKLAFVSSAGVDGETSNGGDAVLPTVQLEYSAAARPDDSLERLRRLIFAILSSRLSMAERGFLATSAVVGAS